MQSSGTKEMGSEKESSEVTHRGDLAPQWQPIETAPRDGTWILVTGGRTCHRWESLDIPPCVVAQWGGACWQFAWYDSGWYGEYDEPTHWKPLDTPPEAD